MCNNPNLSSLTTALDSERINFIRPQVGRNEPWTGMLVNIDTYYVHVIVMCIYISPIQRDSLVHPTSRGLANHLRNVIISS